MHSVLVLEYYTKTFFASTYFYHCDRSALKMSKYFYEKY